MGSILGDLVRHPGLIFRLPVLRKHAGQAMASVHRGITELDVTTKS
jgi:hypothetical protein